MFTDTLLAGTTSQHGHKFAQVFAASYGWSRIIPITQTSVSLFAPVRLFRHEGVPTEMILAVREHSN